MRHVAWGMVAGIAMAAAGGIARAQESGGEAGGTEPLYSSDSASMARKTGDVVPRREGVRKIMISGGIELAGVYRSDFFDQVFGRSGAVQPPPPALPVGREETFTIARFNLNISIDVNDDLSGYFEIDTAPDVYAFESHRVGDDNQVARFRQGYLDIASSALGIPLDDFDARLRLGIQEVRIENRRLGAEGHPFLIDLLNSENPFTGTASMQAAQAGAAIGPDGATPVVPPFGSQGFGLTTRNTLFGGNAWWHNAVGQKRTQEAGGARAIVRLAKDSTKAINADLDLGGFTVLETGLAQGDVNVGHAVLDFTFGNAAPDYGLPDHHSLFSVIGMAVSGDESYIGSIGGAFAWFFFNNTVELFGEGHYQGGAFVNLPNAAGSDVTRHEAFGGYGGIRFQAPYYPKSKPYLEVSYWTLSGDDGVALKTNGRMNANKDFISFENVNHSLILESSEIGLDLDSNYSALKIQGGVTLLSKVDFSVFVGVFTMNEEPNVALLPAGVTSVSDKLGTEVNVRLTWRPSETVRLSLALASLSGGTFFEDMQRGDDHAIAGSFAASVLF